MKYLTNMKFIELSMENGKMTDVSELPEEAKQLMSDDDKSVMVIDYPVSDTNGLIISPALDWDMGDENITRSIVNLKQVTSVGIFNGPSCDIYQKIDDSQDAWIYYSVMDETILLKV
jgi:hypothetical protein